MVVADDHPTRQRLTTVPESPCASPDTAPYCETDLNLAKSLNLKPHADVGSAQLDTVVSQHEIERAAVLEKEAMKCICRGEVREAVATFDAAVDMRGGTADMQALHTFVVALNEQALLRLNKN